MITNIIIIQLFKRILASIKIKIITFLIFNQNFWIYNSNNLKIAIACIMIIIYDIFYLWKINKKYCNKWK